MVKSTFFTGQPVFAQLCKYLDRDEVLKISTESGGERYRKYLTRGCIRADIREQDAASANGLVPKRSTLGDANAKRGESIFGDNNFMPKHANFDDGDVRLSQGRHDAQGEDRFVC